MTTHKRSDPLPKPFNRGPRPGAVRLFRERLVNGREVASQMQAPTEATPAGVAKGKKQGRKREVGSSRGIETTFRTAYRAQLDLTALAATKANIVISLNGLILLRVDPLRPFRTGGEAAVYGAYRGISGHLPYVDHLCGTSGSAPVRQQQEHPRAISEGSVEYSG